MADATSNVRVAATNWPLASHFSTMLQNPKFAFRDPQLKLIGIDRDERNQPRAFAGSFANVYHGTFANGKGSLAVRVFTSGAPERRERYQAISDFVGRRRVDSLVGFTYTDDGVRSTDGRWYPLVTMEWVSGETLYKWVREKCLERDRSALTRISELWIDLVNELLAAQIAHGDLQHGNVMVTDTGRLKLVDYDCMCVPALVGRRNLEVGVKPYQHPQRNDETQLNLNLDSYSALVILVALKALAAAPELWDTFVESSQYDKILFREEDFSDPQNSNLIEALNRSSDAEVRQLSRDLLELSRLPLEKMPPLPNLLFSYARVESLLNQGDFSAAVDMISRGRRPPAEASPELQARIRQAQERVQCLKSLETAVAAGDEVAMQRWYFPRLLDDYPGAQAAVDMAKQAPAVVALLERLQRATQGRQWRELVSTWESNAPLLEHRKSAEPFAADVATWRGRNQACDVVLQLIGQPEVDAARLDSAWTQLLRHGGHPEAEPHRKNIESIIRRHRAWVAFQQVPRTASEAGDARLIEAWNESLFAGWEPAELERPRVTQARQRQTLLSQLRQQSEQETTLTGESGLLQLASGFPEGYQFELQSRVQLARQRLEATGQLEQALKEPTSDLAIEAAWNKLGELEAQRLIGAKAKPTIDLALKRAPLIQSLQQIPPDYPAEHAEDFDAQLLAAWQGDVLAKSADAEPWRKAHAQAVTRKSLLGKLENAIADGDKPHIAALVSEPALKDYPLPRGWVQVVKQAIADVEAARKLLSALEHDRRAKFHELFDTRIIRENAATFEPHEEKLRQWLQTEVLPVKKLGLAPPTGQKELVWEGTTAPKCRTQWNWPAARFTDQCLLVVCPEAPEPGDDLREAQHHLRVRIERKSYEEGGGSRTLNVQEKWLGGYVVVAAVVDLGFDTFVSESLILGRLESPKHGRRNGRRGGIAP